jgi:hypothetical protein
VTRTLFGGLLLASLLGLSAWQVNAAEGLWTAGGQPVCTATGHQSSAEVVADGSGGAVIVWPDMRNGNSDLYAQRVNGSGASQWTSDGVAICTTANTQVRPQLIPSGGGGAILVWQDYPGSDFLHSDIYAQRVDEAGNPLWTANGRAICTDASMQGDPQLVPAGAGGVIIVWTDLRTANNSIYAQRVDGAGNTLWAADGILICTAANSRWCPRLVADGAGGVIITWWDTRNHLLYYDLYAQRVDSTGNTLWAGNGVPVCTGTATEYVDPMQIISDGSGGAIIAWSDYRSSNWYDIHAQRINGAGVVQWAVNGTPVCAAWREQWDPHLSSDGNGGAIIAWDDARFDASSSLWDVYAQRINGSGNAVWATDGIPICTLSNGKNYPRVLTGGDGGAIITWNGFGSQVFAARVDGTGNSVWAANGLVLSSATANANDAKLAADGSGGAIFTWSQIGVSGLDVTAQRIVRCKPQVLSINSPGVAGRVFHATITGRTFQDNQGSVTSARLTKTGQGDILASNISVASATSLTCDFDLTAAVLGDWNVVVSDNFLQQSVENVILPIQQATPTPTITATATPSPTPTHTPVLTPTPTATATHDPMADLDWTGRSFMAFPNPARDHVNFFFRPLDHAAEGKIALYNLVGERVANLTASLASGSVRSMVWDCHDIAPGIYIAYLTVDGKELGKSKVAVVK